VVVHDVARRDLGDRAGHGEVADVSAYLLDPIPDMLAVAQVVSHRDSATVREDRRANVGDRFALVVGSIPKEEIRGISGILTPACTFRDFIDFGLRAPGVG
jgi:hypothetical protein